MTSLKTSTPLLRREYLAHGVIVAGDYGVLGAEKKAGKTWKATDLAVNVAAGGAWLGLYPIDCPGPVLYFAGEGGKRKIVRRIRAAADFYGIDATDLPIKICTRAPKLTHSDHLQVFSTSSKQPAPSSSSSTPPTSQPPEPPHRTSSRWAPCSSASNTSPRPTTPPFFSPTTGTRRAPPVADRFTGAGYAEWGRFLMSVAVLSKHTDTVTQESSVLMKVEITGDELPDTELTLRRIVRAENPDDLASPLHYEVQQIADDALAAGEDPELRRPQTLRRTSPHRASRTKRMDRPTRDRRRPGRRRTPPQEAHHPRRARRFGRPRPRRAPRRHGGRVRGVAGVCGG